MWSAQNTAFDHIFDHLQTRTTWKQCQQEHGLAPFLDTKAPKITRNYTKNLCRTLRDAKVVGSRDERPQTGILYNARDLSARGYSVLGQNPVASTVYDKRLFQRNAETAVLCHSGLSSQSFTVIFISLPIPSAGIKYVSIPISPSYDFTTFSAPSICTVRLPAPLFS